MMAKFIFLIEILIPVFPVVQCKLWQNFFPETAKFSFYLQEVGPFVDPPFRFVQREAYLTILGLQTIEMGKK